MGVREHVLSRLLGAFGLAGGLFMAWACVLALVCAGRYGLAAPVLALVAAGVAALAVLGRRRPSARLVWRVWVVAQTLSLPVMLALALKLSGNVGTDYEELRNLALCVVDGVSPADHMAYYVRYPNNHGLLFFMIWLFRTVRLADASAGVVEFTRVSVALNVVVVEAAVVTSVAAARLMWGRGRAACVGLALLLCPPVWLNLSNPYSDTIGMLLVALGCLLAAYAFSRGLRGCRAWLALAGLGVVGATGFVLKPTACILVVACALVVLARARPRVALACVAVLVVSMLVGCAALSAAVDLARPAELPYGQEQVDEGTFPPEHWVMMGLNADSSGQYTLADQVISQEAPSYAARVAVDRAQIGQRLGEMGVAGTLRHVLVDKVTVQWQSGTYQLGVVMDTLLAGGPYHALDVDGDADGRVSALFACVFVAAQAFHVLLLVGMGVAAASLAHVRREVAGELAADGDRDARLRSRSAQLLFCGLALAGLTFFLCVLWEVKPRYLLHYLPVMAFLAAEGLAWLSSHLAYVSKPMRSRSARSSGSLRVAGRCRRARRLRR